MIFLSILIALVVERVAPQLVELRLNPWLREYSEWMISVLHIERFAGWMGLAVLVFPVIVVIWIISGMFENAFFGLFELAFNVAVIFFCLGPKELNSQVDKYLDAIEVGDSQQRFDIARQITREVPSMELSTQVIQVCKAIYVEANSRLFAILFWFLVLGPVAVVLYRLLEQLLNSSYLQQSLASVTKLSHLVLGWVDWLPAHITLFVYMVSGNFEEGLQKYRQGSVAAVDMYEQNNELLQTVGFHSIASHDVPDENQAIDIVRKSRGLVLRSLVVWLFITALLSILI